MNEQETEIKPPVLTRLKPILVEDAHPIQAEPGFRLKAPEGPAVKAARKLDQRTPGGMKNWICRGPLDMQRIVVQAATRGEARAQLKKSLGIPERGRVPLGWTLVAEIAEKAEDESVSL